MKKLTSLLLFVLVISPLFSDEVMIFTANRYFNSRIYTLSTNGTVQNYIQYDNYHFCDMAVVNNELYVAEAFAPRVLKVNLETGELDVIIDDWSLYYFYDLAFDGTYFYVTEWDLNRYDINGVKDGTASFDEDVFGSTWDGQYLWMLNDNNQIKCWNVALWPNLIEVTANAFSPPSSACRGLWFDGTYFWSTESLDGSLGYIYKFDYSGQVIDQILAPSWVGFGVCKLDMPVSADDPHQNSTLNLTAAPNPFHDYISISFSLLEPQQVTCALYNIRGEKIDILFSELFPSGINVYDWNIQNLKTGVYFLKLQTQQTKEIQKIIHL
ncbi:MAG: T9SS type A sorting domain-containing protein [Candidatus Cloacimonetes bacterium]|nr:T9SS type A sorting domain-containing protein [Candidatus Cloacimonadota bacterium]